MSPLIIDAIIQILNKASSVTKQMPNRQVDVFLKEMINMCVVILFRHRVITDTYDTRYQKDSKVLGIVDSPLETQRHFSHFMTLLLSPHDDKLQPRTEAEAAIETLHEILTKLSDEELAKSFFLANSTLFPMNQLMFVIMAIQYSVNEGKLNQDKPVDNQSFHLLYCNIISSYAPLQQKPTFIQWNKWSIRLVALILDFKSLEPEPENLIHEMDEDIRFGNSSNVIHFYQHLKIPLRSDVKTWRDDRGWSYLHLAAFHELNILIPELLQRGLSVHDQTIHSLSTPLHFAAKADTDETMRLLLTSKPLSGLSAKDKAGRSPIDYATEKAKKGEPDILLLLQGYMSQIQSVGSSLRLNFT